MKQNPLYHLHILTKEKRGREENDKPRYTKAETENSLELFKDRKRLAKRKYKDKKDTNKVNLLTRRHTKEKVFDNGCCQ